MTDIVQILVLVVIGSFITIFASAVGFVVGRAVGNGLQTGLAAGFTTLGLSDDTATTVAGVVESVALAVSAATVFVLVFPPTGFLAASRPQDLVSLAGSFWLMLVVGGAVVLLATVAGVAVSARSAVRSDGQAGAPPAVTSQEDGEHA
jgi:type III secretory pathway component EscS